MVGLTITGIILHKNTILNPNSNNDEAMLSHFLKRLDSYINLSIFKDRNNRNKDTKAQLRYNEIYYVHCVIIYPFLN